MVGVTEFLSSISIDQSLGLDVLFLALILAVVSLFIWEFYKSTSKRNIIKLDLRKYNTSSHPLTSKFLALVLYSVEYIIIIPILLILWFAGLAFVLLLIAKERTLDEILFISAGMIIAIRLLAYYNSEISKDLAKLFPFITLSFFLLTPGAFNFSEIVSLSGTIKGFLDHILSYIIVILIIEVILRFIYSIYEFWRSEEVNPPPEDNEEN